MYDAIVDPYAYETEISNARSGETLPEGELDFEHYSAVHHHLFQDVYTWAGRVRTVRISKQGNPFCYPEHIEAQATKLFAELKANNFLESLGPDEFSTQTAH